MLQSENLGSAFLHERNNRFHLSSDVEHVTSYLRQYGETIPNEPKDKIAAYLGFLATQARDGILTGESASLERQIEAHAVTPEEIPESYFNLQRRIAREQGHGDIELSDAMRHELGRIISNDQSHSLAQWAEYLASEDGAYPDWFKLYAFDGVTRMGKYDKEKGRFQKRGNNTVTPFPELSRGALSKVYSWVDEVKIQNNLASDVASNEVPEAANYDDATKIEARESLQTALEKANFSELYAKALHYVESGTISSQEKDRLIGKWRCYRQNSDPKSLYSDLQGFGLDWCTSTGISTTEAHLNGGDFYVHYTQNDDGEYVVPRIAIRMQDGQVAEVRGVEPDQELEPNMLPAATEKIQTLPGGEYYMKAARDMKQLTQIDNRLLENPNAQLSITELRFLYEIDSTVESFGYRNDPRLAEILGSRDKRQDIATALKLRLDQISFTTDEVLSGISIYHFGDLSLDSLTSAEGLQLPQTVNGDLSLGNLTSAEGLQLPQTVNGSLYLSSLTSTEGLQLPQTVNGDLSLDSLTSAEGLQLPETVNGSLFLGRLNSTEGLQLPQRVNGHLSLDSLTSAEGLQLPQTVNGDLSLDSLTSAEGLQLPETVNGSLFLGRLNSTEGLQLPQTVNGSLFLDSLTSAEGLQFPQTFGGEVYFS